MSTFQKLKELLSAKERKHAVLLLCMITVMALIDVVGVASIMPFIAVLANPEIVETNPYLRQAYRYLGFQSTQTFMLALGVMVFMLLVFSLAFKALTTYAQTRFSTLLEYSISKRLTEGYLHQPYSWFLNRNSADLGSSVLSEVGTAVSKGLMPLISIIAQSIVTLALLTLLLVVDPWLALTVLVVLGLSYGLIFKLMSGWLKRLGQTRKLANRERFTALSEAFGAVKEVKVGGLEAVYIRRFAKPAEVYAKTQATAQLISNLPRFVLEAISFGGMILVILYLMTRNGGFGQALPIIVLYAFAGYRLMPALQHLYSAFTQLRFAGPSLDALHADLTTLNGSTVVSSQTDQPMALKQAIELNRVEYQYPNTDKSALQGLHLSIPANSTVAFVGSTGSGKTTTVDLILGLLEASGGSLKVDGVEVNTQNRRQWQKSIGYVPQQIYLSDDSIAANIAFGVNPKNIDHAAVERAATIANLHTFIVGDLPHGYQTAVGERGVRLSGGQRQRIGIARALYHRPSVLILDEATSALDNLTEQAVMDAVHRLSHEITIILIAHRLSTVRKCDQIFLLEKGELLAQGTFDELLATNDQFRNMATHH
jgi:ABC-type multidrug transport system fused ATPase/permease subunit